jgi:phosphatidylserine/phosphatidylglycerophosphate/cardiolipin synthase-like enzyme
LIDAEGRGVEVRVVLDQYPFGGSGNPEETASRLRNSGIEVKWGLDRFTFTHVKTMIVDRSIALIMNLNLTRSAFESNREFAIVTTRPDDVMTAHAIFEADWRDDDDPELGTLAVSPLNSRTELLELLDSAVGTVDIYAEVVRDDEFVARLISLEEEGIQVRIMTSPDPDPVGTGILDELGRSGVEIRLVGTPYIHAKAIVVDDRRVYVGSQNFTETSLDENREVGLILDDVVVTHRIASTFERDFVSADPLIAQS